MDYWNNKVINAKEVAKLYNDKPREWLLLEVLKTGKNNRAELFKLLANSKNKEELHEYVMEDKNWNSNKKYIFVYTDPDKICEV